MVVKVDTFNVQVLHSRYLAHVKSRSYHVSMQQEQQEVLEEEEEVPEDQEQESPAQSPDTWSAVDLLELWQEKQHVEQKLRCIRDEHFYELLQERWLARRTISKETPESLRERLVGYTPPQGLEIQPLAVPAPAGELVANGVIDTKEDMKEKIMKVLMTDTGEEVKLEEEDIKQEVKEELVEEQQQEVGEVPKDKWACAEHYIHLFYDEQDKSVECVLTEQLLAMRRTLETRFPGHDLYRGGKKPAGFARLLLAEWRRHYPGTQENTKTISMKIGRYDRAPALLASQDTKAANGRINWSPAMLEEIKASRERAVALAGAGVGGLVTKLWRREWEAAYPGLAGVDWRQVVSRYHYHFGAERRESVESLGERSGSLESPQLSGGEEEEDIRGFRQWSREMQEDLVTLRDRLLTEDPALDPDSKLFSRRLLVSFQALHPSCMESARSLLSKLQQETVESPSAPAKVRRKPGRKPATPASPTIPATPAVPAKNPALEIVSDIEVCS